VTSLLLRMDIRLGIALCFLVNLLTGCATETCLNKALFTGAVGNYSLLPDDKALFMTVDPKNGPNNGHLFWSFQQPSANDAIAVSRRSCQKWATGVGLDPARCYAVAVNNKQTAFNPTTMYCGATPQTSVADEAAFINSLSNLSNSLKK
jgi:hypothetical protein